MYRDVITGIGIFVVIFILTSFRQFNMILILL